MPIHMTYVGGLTKRQLEFVGCVCAGLTNNEIADKLMVSLSTVRNTIKDIYYKLELHDGNRRLKLLQWAIQNELIRVDKQERAQEIVEAVVIGEGG